MKITRIETFTRDQICVVRVTTEDGSVGWGQVAPFNPDITATVLHRQVAACALGRDHLDVDGLSTAAIDRNHKFPWSYVCRALSGIDTALWDLRGRLEQKSVCELLGGMPGPMLVYGSSMRRDITPEDEAARLVRLRDEHGYRAFKIRIGSVCGHDVDQWDGRTEQIVPACRQAIGADTALLVDANSCYTPRKAIEVGRMLEQHDIGHFEEPCPYWELEWTAEVAAALSVPVAGGEQDNDLAQWRRMIAMDAVDIAQPDLCYIGGMTRALDVARMAAKAQKTVLPHSANHSLVTVFALHLLCVAESAAPYMEFSIEDQSRYAGLYEPRFEVRDGCVQFPEGPGWGVRIGERWIEGASRQVSEGE